MANRRIPAAKQVYIIAALSEGTPINAVCRMFGVGKNGVLRLIRETGAALGDYMRREFRDIPCKRLAMDEQWQYCGKHGQRMTDEEKKAKPGMGDFWLWAAVDADTKLVVSFRIGKRDWTTSEYFVEDVASRITGPVQICTDQNLSYTRHIRAFFRQEGVSYAKEIKAFEHPFNPSEWAKKRKNGVSKICHATRFPCVGRPNLDTTTTSHIERVFLTTRQEIARFGRLTLAYSKKLSMHRFAVAMHLGLYNLVRKHLSLDGQTPAQAAGLEDRKWTIEEVVALTQRYLRAREDAKFEAAFAVR